MTAQEFVAVLQREHEMTLAETMDERDAVKCRWCGQWGAKKFGSVEHQLEDGPGQYPHYPGCLGLERRAALKGLLHVVQCYAEEYSDELRMDLP